MKAWRALFFLLIFVLVCGTVGYALYLDRQDLKAVGQQWAQAFMVLPWAFVVILALAAILGIAFGLKYLLRYEFTEKGAHGTIGQRFFDTREFHPYAPVTISSAHEKATTVTQVVPTLAEMLTDNLLGAGTMYHGYQLLNKGKELAPVIGVFDDVRTFAILGKGGSGKTVRLFYLLIQCILEGATIYLCDPHSNAKGSISKLLGPLMNWVTPAVTDSHGDIEAQNMALISQFTEEMNARLKDDSQEYPPCILAIDEFGTMMEHELYGEACVDAVVGCANKYRKVNGYAVVVLHEVVATGKGKKVQDLIARLRRGLHAIFIMRVDKEYAKFFLRGKQLAQVDKLKPGRCFFIDTEGTIHEDVYTPKSLASDAFAVARKLQNALPAPDDVPLQIAGPREQIASHYYPARPLEPSVTVTPYSPAQQLPERAFLQSQAGESVKPPDVRLDNVRELVKPGETVKPEDEQAILKVYFLLDADRPGKVTRSDILEKLAWNNKKWPILKAVCDKYGIAC